MSQVSRWLGPPTSIRRMQLTSRESSTRPAAFSRRKSPRPKPRNASEPACRKSRRRMPSQKCTRFSASNWNMDPPRGSCRRRYNTANLRRRGARGYDRLMQYRTFGRTGWPVSEIGYGMWGMAGWTGSIDEESERSLDRAVELGCTFFDTAWAYGDGRSEQLLGRLLKRHPDKR